MKLNVVGDSHTVALGHGLRRLIERGEPRPPYETVVRKLFAGYQTSEPFMLDGDGDAVRFSLPRLRKNLKKVTGRSHISASDRPDVFAFGTGVTHRGLVAWLSQESVVPFGISTSARPEQFQRVSAAVFHATVMEYNRYLLAFFEALEKLQIRFLVLSPPPMRDDDGLINPIHGAKVFAELELACRKTMAAELRSRGILVLDALEEAFTADGLMKDEFKHASPEDDHHANGLYGELMLKRVWSVVENLA